MQTSVVNYKDLNFEFRIDAEYYRAEVLKNIRLFDKKDNTVLSDLASFVIGPFGSTVTVDQYVPCSNFRYVRNKDINNFQISDDEQVYIPEQVYKALPQFHIKENDLLITVVGTLGKVAIATKKDVSSIFSCKSTIIRAKKIDPFYLLAYLNSNTGQLFALRGARGAIQQGLNLSDLKEIKVFLPSEDFQKTIRDIVSKAFVFTAEAENLYTQAEQTLLSEFGLLNWKPKHRLSFIKNFSDTQSADRIDAEYFQPMYDEVVKTLKTNFQAKPIGGYDFIDVTTGQYADEYVLPSEGKPYIRGTDLSKGTVSTESLVYIDKRKQKKSKIAKEGDVVVTRVGTIGLSARIPKGCDGGTISDNLIRLRFDGKNLNSFYTALYLGSVLGRNLMIGNSRGSVQQRLNQETLKEIIFPIPKMDIQNKIAEIVLLSDAKRKESKSLLNIAKRGIEMAIEKSEKEAQNWISEGLNRLGIR
ncbi:restriction endonuclease subunit S [bacterium]|nr:restriction endonuclease subunit S [bacterium]MBU1615494.1 restriction endonuclease subunit S [bacterium]